MSTIGRKLAIFTYLIITFIGWIFLTFAQVGWMLLVGRFFVGAGFGGACIILPIYTGEIADTKIRGTLLSFISISVQAGILSSYLLGFIFPIFLQNLASLILVGICIIGALLIPESPQYYVSFN